jgi:purine-binding chemotaxis protein CheW
MRTSKSDQQVKEISRFLTFFIDDEQYGLDISRIKEIIALMNITQIPKTPDFVKGVINLRGSIIPVVDVRLKFGMEAKEKTIETAIVIYEIDHVSIGFIVDRVDDVFTIDTDSISAAPDFGTSIDTTFISGIAEVEEGVIMILDLKNIFDNNELTLVGQMEKRETESEEEVS